jgi:nicotinamidase-related amidase
MSALFVVDLQNDFREIITNEIINHIRNVVNFYRTKEIPIFWIYSIYEDNSNKPEIKRIGNKLESTHIGKSKMCIDGTNGANFIEEISNIIRHDDYIIKKKWYSAFKETNVLEILSKNGITNIILCGVTANTCVLATATHASNAGLSVMLLSDCVNSFNKGNNLFGITEFKKLKGGIIITSTEVINNNK